MGARFLAIEPPGELGSTSEVPWWSDLKLPRLVQMHTVDLVASTPAIDQYQLGGGNMLWTIAVILLVLWVLGLVSSFTIHGFIHLLLVAAIILVLIRVIQGRPVI